MKRPGLSRWATPVERFVARIEVDPETGCWLWTGSLSDGRYGQMMVDGVGMTAHRWSYEHFVGTIPEGKQVDHMCGITRCVCPDHLRPLEPWENVRAYWREQRETCRYGGHLMTPENTVMRLRGTVRRCRACERATQKRYHDKKRMGII